MLLCDGAWIQREMSRREKRRPVMRREEDYWIMRARTRIKKLIVFLSWPFLSNLSLGWDSKKNVVKADILAKRWKE